MAQYTATGAFECQFGREELPAWYFKEWVYIFELAAYRLYEWLPGNCTESCWN